MRIVTPSGMNGGHSLRRAASFAACRKRNIAPCCPLLPADISQMGDARAVAKLLLPPGSAVLAVTSLVQQMPARDTGTVLGVLPRDPVTYYRCV